MNKKAFGMVEVVIIVTIVLLLLALIWGLYCSSPKVTTSMNDDETFESSSRIQVSRIGVFSDSVAYGNRRGIYIIKDRHTGQEFVGVSGIGISETGYHSTGKSSGTTDER